MKADRPMIVDGVEYNKGDEIWDLGSFVAVEARGMMRSYEGLSKDAPGKLPHYVSSGSSAFCLDTGDMYKFHEQTDTWYILKKQIQSGGATPEQIQQAVDNYLEENPVQPGATVEQAAQIEKNKQDISSLSEDIDDIATLDKSYNLYDKTNGIMGSYINSSGDVKQDEAWEYFIVSSIIDLSSFNSFVCANLKPAQIAFYNDTKFVERLHLREVPDISNPITLNRLSGVSNKIRVTYDTTDYYYSTVMVYGGNDIGRPYREFGQTNVSINKDVVIPNELNYNCYDKKILIIGDSIMTYNTDVGKVAHNIESILKANKFVDVAVAGATWCDDSADVVYDGNPSIDNKNFIGNQIQKIINEHETNPDYQEFDICIIGAGTNDGLTKFGWNVNKDGTWIDITDDMIESQFTGNTSAFDMNEYISLDNVDRTTIYGAMRWSVENLINLYPNIKIYILNPIQTAPTVKTGVTFAKKANVIKRISERLSVRNIDTQNCGIYGRYEIKGSNGKYLSDGLHPNDDGGYVEAEYICNKIILDY